jgi:uncharacterized protein YndB with AHSA1/START domain
MTLLRTSRLIEAPAPQIFAAIATPERLARWWGPAGFHNTFDVCEFREGGRWKFVMHGPDGTDYPNECLFARIEAPTQVVIDHVGAPLFRLTLVLTPTEGGTRVDWTQAFQDATMGEQLRAICEPANEQNLDRLTTEVLG